ncbi:hypothetical protein AB0O42_11500 [Streptomyces sp. NPDC089922]|uniref:hypothetical protein n=1 Tax=Streptomyces sp. NPDC089922 TaxID=3155189 RepID=UPI00341D0331
MDGYPSASAVIASAWRELEAPGVERSLVLDAVSDALDTAHPSQEEAERAVGRLVALALGEEPPAVLESALHAICTASTRYRFPYALVEPLAAGVDRFAPLLLDYVLGILADTHDGAALPVVERFLHHPHPDVRREAADAVRELTWARTRQG